MIIEGNPKIPGQLVNAFIGEKQENPNKIAVQLSSNCQTEYRNANSGMLELLLSPILQNFVQMVTSLSIGKKSLKLYIKNCPKIIKAEGYVVWIPSL